MFDAEEQSKYREFKEARRGAADYMRMEGEFSHYLQDHYTAGPVQESLSDECEILVVGAGLRDCYCGTSSSCRFCRCSLLRKRRRRRRDLVLESLPRIACDVESYSYFPLLEEMGYVPSMKFASGFEIMEYCQQMAESSISMTDVYFIPR